MSDKIKMNVLSLSFNKKTLFFPRGMTRNRTHEYIIDSNDGTITPSHSTESVEASNKELKYIFLFASVKGRCWATLQQMHLQRIDLLKCIHTKNNNNN